MVGIFEKWFTKFVEISPLLIVGFSLLPCGLIMGRTFAVFALERNESNLLHSGPLIIGVCCAFVTTMLMYFLKFFRGKVIFCHVDILLTAAAFNLIASGFFFAEDVDVVGSFLSFIAHGLIFVSALSYLHIMTGRKSRSRTLSVGFLWYLLGMAMAISIIANAYAESSDEKSKESEWIYVRFAWLFLPCSLVVLGLLIALKVLHLLGHVDYKTCFDNEVRIANSNGTLFDCRKEVIKRVHFFYVTKSRQWHVSFILILMDAIHYALFIYFMFWFTLNDAVKLSSGIGMHFMMWTVLLGCIIGATSFFFCSIKISFIVATGISLGITILGMILYGAIQTHIPFWLLCCLFGVTFSNIKIAILETSHFRYIEMLIFLFYLANVGAVEVVCLYFVSDLKNSFFYSIDSSTLVAHGFAFVIITVMLLIIVCLEMPRTYNTTLFEIQYGLLGIIFKKHQIEQLNVRYLNDGTIPTITKSDSSSTTGV